MHLQMVYYLLIDWMNVCMHVCVCVCVSIILDVNQMH